MELPWELVLGNILMTKAQARAKPTFHERAQVQSMTGSIPAFPHLIFLHHGIYIYTYFIMHHLLVSLCKVMQGSAHRQFTRFRGLIRAD
jgi:hypothetical protein